MTTPNRTHSSGDPDPERVLEQALRAMAGGGKAPPAEQQLVASLDITAASSPPTFTRLQIVLIAMIIGLLIGITVGVISLLN